MRMYVGDEIPGLMDAVAKVLPSYPDGVLEDKEGNLGQSPVILSSDKWHGPKVTLDQVIDGVGERGFSGLAVENHVAWLCKTDPRVVQAGIIKRQRETERQLKEDE